MGKTLSRRDALKILAAATGGIALSTLPVWKRPFVGVGALPAFAQTSRGVDDLFVSLEWNAGDCTGGESKAGEVDLDLIVFEPGAEMSMGVDDNTCGFGPEAIHVGAGKGLPGTYEVYIAFFNGQGPVTGTVTIRVFTGTSHEQSQVFHYDWNVDSSGDQGDCWIYIANVTFPAGSIVGQGYAKVCNDKRGRKQQKK